MHIPNAITIFRIFLTPLVIWLMIDERMQTAFLLFLIAGLSDGLDGYLAKRYGWQTELGAYLDPIADKMLLVSIYVVLGLSSHLPVWLVIAVVSRDFLIIGAMLLSWVLGRPVPVRPLLVSKVNTVAQIVLALIVLGDLGFALSLTRIIGVSVWVAGGLTIISAGAYLVNWLAFMASYEDQQRQPSAAHRSRHKQVQRVKQSVTGT